MDTAQKILALRKRMQKANVKALYISSADPHQSESVADHWKTVQWLTGFTGSMGYAILTEKEAEFWTDGRYTTQAQREIPENTFHINTIATPQAPLWYEWLSARLQKGDTVAIDGEVLSEAQLRDFKGKLSIENLVISSDRNFIAEIWNDRPSIPTDPIWELEAQYAVETRIEKLAKLREKLLAYGPNTVTLLCGLDDIAWLTNLRGHDNPLYPFFHAYALVSQKEAHLCTNLEKLSESIRAHLSDDGWLLHNYQDINALVSQIPANAVVYTDPYKTPFKLYETVPQSCFTHDGPDLVTAIKAKKSPGEQNNIREANRHEAAAVIRLMRWIEANADSGVLNEYQVGQKLEEFRKLDLLYIQPANRPIVGYAENAALPHYRPTATMSASIKPQGFLLFDVCAHYKCGSTDLTRTVKVGPLTEEMKHDYTLTLKCHIKLATQKFPYGTTGNLLDAIVKSVQWNEFTSFNHGTGHGIGYLLNIHEGPGKIITDFAPAFPWALNTPLEEGMLFSNEPGIYKPGRHGIRLENAVLVQKDIKNEFGQFMRFETVTFLPFEQEAIVVEELSESERDWIDNYHQEVYRRISPLLNKEEQQWLKEKTRPLESC